MRAMSNGRGGVWPWVLLATGTIDPIVNTYTERADPAVRLSDYLGALEFWSRFVELPIVFCENSGHDLSAFQQFGRGRAAPFELLSFVAPPIPFEKGKGYGEALIVRHALENSALIGTDTRIIKVTGRLGVDNFAQIFEWMRSRSFDICADLKSALDYCDCRMFAATIPFLREFLVPEAERLDETATPIMNLERILAFATLKAVAAGLKWDYFPVDPMYSGYSGTWNCRYTKRRYLIRQAAKSLRGLTKSLEQIG